MMFTTNSLYRNVWVLLESMFLPAKSIRPCWERCTGRCWRCLVSMYFKYTCIIQPVSHSERALITLGAKKLKQLVKRSCSHVRLNGSSREVLRLKGWRPFWNHCPLPELSYSNIQGSSLVVQVTSSSLMTLTVGVDLGRYCFFSIIIPITVTDNFRGNYNNPACF